MPWKNQPEWIQAMMAVTAFAIVAGVGAMAKIADEVKNGGREKFWSAKLWLEFPMMALMGAVCYGIASHWELTLGPAIGLTAFMGWAGPKVLDYALINRLGPPPTKKSND